MKKDNNNNFADCFNEVKADDCRRVTEAYEALPPDAQRLYRLIEAAGIAIEKADNATLEAVADMARFQSCHCPLGQILQDAVGGERAKRDYFYAFVDNDEYVGEEDDDADDFEDDDDDDVVYEDDEVVVYDYGNLPEDDDGDEDYVEEEYEEEDEDGDYVAVEAE